MLFAVILNSRSLYREWAWDLDCIPVLHLDVIPVLHLDVIPVLHSDVIPVCFAFRRYSLGPE